MIICREPSKDVSGGPARDKATAVSCDCYLCLLKLAIAKKKGREKKKKETSGLPSWNGKESACQCRRHGYDPWSGKIPHVEGKLCPCTSTTEPVLWSLGAATTGPTYHNCWSPNVLETTLPNKRSCRNEKPARCMEEEPQLTATRESQHTAMKTQHSQK